MSNRDHTVSLAANMVGEDALSALLFANTPSYLTRHLILSGLPDSLASRLGNDQLAGMIQSVLLEESPTAEHLTCMYSGIIALAYRGLAMPDLRNRGRVQWIEEVNALAKSHFDKSNNVTIHLAGPSAGQISDKVNAVSSSASTQSKLPTLTTES